MFTGIIEATGIVRSLVPSESGARLAIDIGQLGECPALGSSIAVNGVCQTVAAARFPVAEFDVIPETLRRTTTGRLASGDTVNLERSLRAGGRLEGHIVQGHVDGVAVVTEVVRTGSEWRLWLEADDPAIGEYIIPKGSVAVDGVSLTVAERSAGRDGRFCVALIPTTVALSTLGRRRVGDAVNIETDILARTVISHLRRLGGSEGRAIDLAFLHEHGFV